MPPVVTSDSGTDKARVLAEAVLRAGGDLGLSADEIGEVVGKHRTSLSRGKLAPDTKQGELGLMLVRIYRSLFALMGGDTDNMKHFMHTPNLGTGGVPSEQIQTVEGLYRVLSYLDAMRGRA
jgi:hypothetical protein